MFSSTNLMYIRSGTQLVADGVMTHLWVFGQDTVEHLSTGSVFIGTKNIY